MLWATVCTSSLLRVALSGFGLFAASLLTFVPLCSCGASGCCGAALRARPYTAFVTSRSLSSFSTAPLTKWFRFGTARVRSGSSRGRGTPCLTTRPSRDVQRLAAGPSLAVDWNGRVALVRRMERKVRVQVFSRLEAHCTIASPRSSACVSSSLCNRAAPGPVVAPKRRIEHTREGSGCVVSRVSARCNEAKKKKREKKPSKKKK